jgi:hypothetical protein
VDEPAPADPDDEPGNVLGEVVLLSVLPLAPAPAPERCWRWQSSSSVPVRPTHWLGVTVLDAPPAALPESLPPVVLLEVPELPLPTLEPVEPDVPALEPDDWASVAVERASSAAAVAAVMVFNIMCWSPGGDW